MTPLAALALAGCLALPNDADRIVLRDVAPAFSGLGSADPDATVGFAPAPGVPRHFGLLELRRLAARWNLPEPSREICLERRMTSLDPARILAALRALLPSAHVELIDYWHGSVPEGELEFSPAGLPAGATIGIWRGVIRYGGNRRYAVWAKVRLVPDVARGDMVHVEVHSGAAVVAFEAEAQASGVAGQTIPLLNPISKRRFNARVVGKNAATVQEGPQ